MRRILLAMTLAGAMAGGGLAVAQAPPATADEHAAHHPAKASPPAPAAAGKASPAPAAKGGAAKADGGMCPMSMSMMGGGMMGGGGMGAMPMPMSMSTMGGAATKIDVKKLDKGVTITLTSNDAATAARLQKMAEAMRLMHEATAQ